MRSRPRTVLSVFVSSPSDCREERELVETVVAEVNASPAAQATRLELQAIRWENLPPGETIEQDYQGRIDDLMARAGLDRFEIYLGFMRERIGTPTRGHPSGTLSEFASARERRRVSGLPSELLFYFLSPVESMSPEVTAIRQDFERRGFLYSVAPSNDIFRARLREHLLHIMVTWWHWKNRLHRQLRNLRIGLAYVTIALLTGYVAFDIATFYSFNRNAATQNPEAAIQLWHDRSAYLPIVRWGGEKAVDELLRRVAASRLTQSLTSQGFDPFRWKQQHLRPFEAEVLSALARERLEPETAHMAEPDPKTRLAWATLAEDWNLLRQLATSAALAGEVHDPVETRGFIEYAPADQVRRWLKQDLDASLPNHIAARILEAVGRRAEPSITFAALESLHDGKLGQDAKRFDLRLECGRENDACSAPAAAMLTSWLADDTAPSKPALELLLQWSSTYYWSRSQVLALEPSLLRLLVDSKYSEISPALIRFLAKWHSQVGAGQLAARVKDHVTGRINFGFHERVALIEALPILDLREIDVTALTIAQRSATDAEHFSRSGPSDALVQAAYVRSLASNPDLDWRLHRDWVQTILERRLQNQFPNFHHHSVDQAFATLLANASPSRFMDLFEKPVAPIVDSFDGALSTRRSYLLDLLPSTATRLPEGVVNDICQSIPVVESRRPSFYRALAIHGATAGMECLRRQLPQDARVMSYLAKAGDTETLIRMLPGAPEETPTAPWISEDSPNAPTDLTALMEAAARLPPEGRTLFIDAAQQVQHSIDPVLLWPLASEPAVRNQTLIIAASEEIVAAEEPARVVAAIMYLNAVSCEPTIWQAISASADRFIGLMHNIDSFGWLSIAQILPPPPDEGGLAVLSAILKERQILLALEIDQAKPSAVLPDRLMGVRDKWIGNPLGRLLALTPSNQAAVALQSAHDATPTAVDVVGSLADSQSAYRNYMGWLLAEVLISLPEQDLALVDRRTVSGWIGNSDPLKARVMAGLTLAFLGQSERASSGPRGAGDRPTPPPPRQSGTAD